MRYTKEDLMYDLEKHLKPQIDVEHYCNTILCNELCETEKGFINCDGDIYYEIDSYDSIDGNPHVITLEN